MIDLDVLESPTVQERVTLSEPEHGWSREEYERALSAYVEEHGRAPQTVTMHPETAAALGVGEAVEAAPLLVTSRDYDRRTITWYY